MEPEANGRIERELNFIFTSSLHLLLYHLPLVLNLWSKVGVYFSWITEQIQEEIIFLPFIPEKDEKKQKNQHSIR